MNCAQHSRDCNNSENFKVTVEDNVTSIVDKFSQNITETSGNDTKIDVKKILIENHENSLSFKKRGTYVFKKSDLSLLL